MPGRQTALPGVQPDSKDHRTLQKDIIPGDISAGVRVRHLPFSDRILAMWGGMRVVGVRSAFWMARYRIGLASGWDRARTPLKTWKEVEQAIPRDSISESIEIFPRIFPLDCHNLKKEIKNWLPSSAARNELGRILKGRFAIWDDPDLAAGYPPDWNRNVLTGQHQSASLHWSQIRENATGDIKGLWEVSRFAAAYRLARIYVASGDERAPAAFWQLMESWMDKNPPNAGPQWFEGQEVALRAIAWEFAGRAFVNAQSTTPAHMTRWLSGLREHALRIEATLAYARAQNNNHLISSAAGLYTIGRMHPRLPGADRWRTRGRALLLEAAEQFFRDGGYIQHSINYHRLALQLYIWCMRLAEEAKEPFPDALYGAMERSLDLLLALVDPATGHAPNFGHNDGALLLPINACAFADYRPLIQCLSVWLRKRRAFAKGPWDEDACWLLGSEDGIPSDRIAPPSAESPHAYPDAGLFVLAGRKSRAIIRCAHFRSRPAHADQLNVDLWWQGENVACDAGTFQYSGELPWQNVLAHAGVHNTVTVDTRDQMRRTGRFLWTTLAQGKVAEHSGCFWRGSHDGYRALGVMHRRTVELVDDRHWRVEDILEGKGDHNARLHWLIPDYPWEWRDGIPASMGKGKWREDVPEGGCTLNLATPSGKVSLILACSRPVSWNLFRAGELLQGGKDDDWMDGKIRGWRSLHYASKIPALSLAGIAAGGLPFRFVTIWML